ncbi:MAG: TRAM domain-containing protein [Phycisphaeraceae bacterium]|nr:TRAM domain-containing protein [Phycisphaeraceae bacterium]
MILYLLRGGFILLATSVMCLYLLSSQYDLQLDAGGISLSIGFTVGACLTIIAIDIFTRRQKLAALSGIFLGLLAGLVLAYALSFVVDLVGLLFAPGEDGARRAAFFSVLEGVKVFIGLITCYMGISLVLQTKDDFRFVIPYVEFAKQYRERRPTFVDTSALIDGRIEELIAADVIPRPLIVPQFVVHEMQQLADSDDRIKRQRGRRGLEILRRLQQDPTTGLAVEDHAVEGATVDHKLVTLCRQNRGRLMTLDFNLAQVAQVRNLDVINLNDVSRALQPQAITGESMEVEVVKPGENEGQGVGYLEDGTMVVIENGADAIGEKVTFNVTSTLQTSAGRMIFGQRAQVTNKSSAES